MFFKHWELMPSVLDPACLYVPYFLLCVCLHLCVCMYLSMVETVCSGKYLTTVELLQAEIYSQYFICEFV